MKPRDLRLYGFAFACLLSAMLLLSCPSTPPLVPLARLHTLDDGQSVAIAGLLVQLIVHESGAESLVLLDPRTGTTATVVSIRGLAPQPSLFVHVGDELRATGKVFHRNSSAILFVRSDDISVLRPSTTTLSVQLLAENWQLFVGDDIRLVGVLTMVSGEDYALSDSDFMHKIRLEGDPSRLSGLVGRWVEVDGQLILDPTVLSFVLEIDSVVPWNG